MKEFLGCQIDYSLHNFSPRDETEFWVGKEIKEIQKTKFKRQNYESKLKILDIFSGTGCIGLAVLNNLENSQVDFVDIWPKAIEQIKINLKFNKTEKGRYKIYQSNLFKKIAAKKYDFIFANPPYVALDRISEVQPAVLKKEPKVALFGGKDGMTVIENFLNQVKNYLTSDGKLFMEFDPQQQNKIKEILNKESFKVIFRKDQFGKIRWLEAILKD